MYCDGKEYVQKQILKQSTVIEIFCFYRTWAKLSASLKIPLQSIAPSNASKNNASR